LDKQLLQTAMYILYAFKEGPHNYTHLLALLYL